MTGMFTGKIQEMQEFLLKWNGHYQKDLKRVLCNGLFRKNLLLPTWWVLVTQGEVILLSQVTPPAQLDPNAKIVCKRSEMASLFCSDLSTRICLGYLTLTVSSEQPKIRSEFATIFEQARAKIPQTHIEVKTIRKHGIVQLEVPQESQIAQDGTIRECLFFPEQKM